MEENKETTVEEIKPMTLEQKIMELKKLVCIMKKDSEGHGFKYVNEESILLTINDKMMELGLKLTPRFIPGTLYSEIVNYKNAKGQEKTDVLVRSEMQFIWKDIESGETETIDWILLGQQADGSQALGSGLTYANRYFLLKYFNIATSEDDPDAIRSKIAQEEETKKLSAVQTQTKKALEKLIKRYQTQEKIYEVMGTTRENFIKNYNDAENCKNLLEQMELILKEDKNA